MHVHHVRCADHVQVSLPTETASGTTFLGLYIESILALQRASNASKPLPLAIMTSDDTHEATRALLEEHSLFCAEREQIILMKQSKVPCLADNAGRLALEEDDPYQVMTKPHGHGDVHSLLHDKGIANRWVEQGFEWVAFFQDTNALVFRGLLPSLGALPTSRQ
jgi:UDP-sugar pyrophosphorylase